MIGRREDHELLMGGFIVRFIPVNYWAQWLFIAKTTKNITKKWLYL